MTNNKYFVISCFMDVKIKAEFRYTNEGKRKWRKGRVGKEYSQGRNRREGKDRKKGRGEKRRDRK